MIDERLVRPSSDRCRLRRAIGPTIDYLALSKSTERGEFDGELNQWSECTVLWRVTDCEAKGIRDWSQQIQEVATIDDAESMFEAYLGR